MPVFVSDEELQLLGGDATAIAERADAFIRDLQRKYDARSLEVDEMQRTIDLLLEQFDRSSSRQKDTLRALYHMQSQRALNDLENFNEHAPRGKVKRSTLTRASSDPSIAEHEEDSKEKKLLQSQNEWLKKELKNQEHKLKLEEGVRVESLRLELFKCHKASVEKFKLMQDEIRHYQAQCDLLKKGLAQHIAERVSTANISPVTPDTSDSSSNSSGSTKSSCTSKGMEYLEVLECGQSALSPVEECTITNQFSNLFLGDSPSRGGDAMVLESINHQGEEGRQKENTIHISTPCIACKQKIVLEITLLVLNEEVERAFACHNCGYTGCLKIKFRA